MTVQCVPPLDTEPWPTLGPQVCEFIETYLVFGPGDLRGEPARLDAEKRALIYRMYEVYPQGHEWEGRRRFKRVAISLRKGSAKTEFAAWIAACELHPDGPVRCDGFDAHGDPVGVGVVDPYIPMIAYTEEQSDELAYGALRVILMYSQLSGDFDIGLERIMRIGGDGKAVSLAGTPNARDGARTTFQHFDETHRFTLPKLQQAHRTMLANVPKRYMSDAWSLETTTAPAPGEGSVAEATWDYARQVEGGKVSDSRLFFFHRQDDEATRLEDDAGELDLAAVRRAVLEASGPVAEWSDIDGIIEQFRDPTADRSYLERVWLNRLVRASERAFDVLRWKALGDPERQIAEGELIMLGFDGARYHDATALVATHVVTGHQWLVGLWEQPYGQAEWEVPADEVDAAVADIFGRYEVWRMYCDPPYWESYVAAWAGQFGEKRVMEWWTRRPVPMAYAIKAYHNAIIAGELSHDANPHLTRHVGNACRRYLTQRDDQGQPLWTMYKERQESPHKIDGAMAGVLSWEARSDAVTAGVGVRKRSVYEDRGLMVV
ncbi:MAG: terminase [Chloroflexi bacterium]|nr:terminase [Chloroflexota bacterium]